MTTLKQKTLKFILILTILFFYNFVINQKCFGQITAISNLEVDNFYLAFNAQAKNHILINYNIKTNKTIKLQLPKETLDKEILALYSFKQNLFLVAQRTLGDPAKPIIFIFDSTKKSWRNAGEIDCPSFDKVIFNKKTIHFKCEVIDYNTKTGYKYVQKSISTIENSGSYTIKLPLLKSQSGDFLIELLGEPLFWNKISIKKKKLKSWISVHEIKLSDLEK